jgi:protein tyrosine phosphatase (PTP) superfamily phosphohydrolase (DUF442 family)
MKALGLKRRPFVHDVKRLALILLVALAGVAPGADLSTNRPASWGQPVRIEGVPNLYKVADGLYRSAQPTAEGLRNLKQAGMRTILNLRSFHSDQETAGDAKLDYENIPEKSWHPEDEDAVRFLQAVTDTNRMPVLAHCQHGADRTGTMCAVYRIVVQGWSKEEAIREMTEGGYGFHAVWMNLPHWIRTLDVDAVKRAAGIRADAGSPHM